MHNDYSLMPESVPAESSEEYISLRNEIYSMEEELLAYLPGEKARALFRAYSDKRNTADTILMDAYFFEGVRIGRAA